MTRWLMWLACGVAGCGDKKPSVQQAPTATTHYLTFERQRDEDGRKEWYPDVTLDGAINARSRRAWRARWQEAFVDRERLVRVPITVPEKRRVLYNGRGCGAPSCC